jgi:DNA invertase Pin-like site-specific DNA recombinase
MLERIERGEAAGILAWHPDRLARNSVDGGRIIYLLDTGKLAGLKFPTFWFESTPQGKFMLNIAFGQSKYYVDSLSENTKRGLRQKVKRGEYPSVAPIGYINDVRNKSIIVDRKKAKVIKAAFEYYATGNARLEDVSEFLAQRGIFSRAGKRIYKTRATFILSNPFYTGLFRYSGEIYEGRYEPIITKKLFDTAQEVMRRRGKPQRKPKNDPQAFCGLISCAECGMMITAEKQKGHIYYRCSKKGKKKCSQPYVREEDLDRQLSSLMQKVSLRQDWADKLLKMAEVDKEKSAQSVAAFVQQTQDKIRTIQTKLQRLLDGYLEQDIEREIYREQKAVLLSEKKTLEEKMARIEQKQNDWLEPFENWIKVASNLVKIANDSNLLEKKVAAKEIFGSNLRLVAREARGNSLEPHFSAQHAAELVGKKSESSILVRDTRVELVSSVWKTDILADIRIPHQQR